MMDDDGRDIIDGMDTSSIGRYIIEDTSTSNVVLRGNIVVGPPSDTRTGVQLDLFTEFLHAVPAEPTPINTETMIILIEAAADILWRMNDDRNDADLATMYVQRFTALQQMTDDFAGIDM